MHRHTQKRQKRGAAMLDVVMSSILTAVVLVPSVNIMRRSLQVNSLTQLRREIDTLGSSIVEQQMSETTRRFRSGRRRGRRIVGGEHLRYEATRSDQATLGGIPGKLMGISISVWHDKNRNRRRDQSESEFSLYTKVARL